MSFNSTSAKGANAYQKTPALNSKYKSDFYDFLSNYLLPLLGLSDSTLSDGKNIHLPKYVKSKRLYIAQEGNTIYFPYYTQAAGVWDAFMITLDSPNLLSQDNLKLSPRIIQCFDQLCPYKRTGSGKQNIILNSVHKNSVYQMAIEKGICHWIAGDSEYDDTTNRHRQNDHHNEDKIEELLSILEQWSVKTYEGRNVTLGFVIDPDQDAANSTPLLPLHISEGSEMGSSPHTVPDKKAAKNQPSAEQDTTFLSFLKDDTAAVLTDCIHSVIVLDSQCNFVRYESIAKNDQIRSTSLDSHIPLRFTHVIQQHIPARSRRVGIFLLNNGDIILSKNEEIRFVKRNLHWLNFSYEAFKNAMKPFLEEYDLTDDTDHLIGQIFASVLDVSFSHTGGIIAVVDPQKQPAKPFESQVLSEYDNLKQKIHYAEFYQNKCDKCQKDAENKKIQDPKEIALKMAETRKKLLKRSIIERLILDDDRPEHPNKRFQDLDRKLRSELIALDGACILDTKGDIYSFGAIISNDSGSSGGGRGAAAKKLSSYGMAIKISTDGYIEMYINRILKYSVK